MTCSGGCSSQFINLLPSMTRRIIVRAGPWTEVARISGSADGLIAWPLTPPLRLHLSKANSCHRNQQVIGRALTAGCRVYGYCVNIDRIGSNTTSSPGSFLLRCSFLSGLPTRSHPACQAYMGSTQRSSRYWRTLFLARAEFSFWARIHHSPLLFLRLFFLCRAEIHFARSHSPAQWQSSQASSASEQD